MRREQYMLTYNNLVKHFPGVQQLAASVFKFRDVTPSFVYHYYIRLEATAGDNGDLLLVSENKADDEFALWLLGGARLTSLPGGLQLQELPTNKYGFSALLLADKD